MTAPPLAIVRTGLVSSVGLSSPAACAAIRAKVTNPTETRFIDADGEWIMAHQVPLERPWSGRTKLVKMAALAIEECLVDVARDNWIDIPLLLCVAEPERPGRVSGLEDRLFDELQRELGVAFAAHSLVIPHGRVSVATALAHARNLTNEGGASCALIAAVDSLVAWATLSGYERESRLLTARNSNGFMPGEGAAAILVSPRPRDPEGTWITGIGFAVEKATITSDEPLRGDGLSAAIKRALSDAGCGLHDLDLRVADVSGEQYYFKEAALAVSRVLRARKSSLEIWHPAECIGEAGAVAGLASLTVAEAACRKAYAPGPGILCHAANDAGHRAAVVLHNRAR